MDFIHLLNTKKRKNKNLFNVFYKQKIKQNHHIKIDAKENKSIEPITNQYENLPKIENDEIKKIDLDIIDKSKNDIVLETLEAKSCLENIINQKPLSKLDVLSEEVKTENLENISLPLIKDETVDKDLNVGSVNVDENNFKKRKKNKNISNIFKKFKKNK